MTNNLPMKTINFKDGDITVPSDFIELYLINPDEAEIPMVMNVKNGNLYNTPNFVFFANTYPYNLTDEEIQALYNQAEYYYPGYRKLNDLIVHAIFYKDTMGKVATEFRDVYGNRKTKEDWEKAPCIGIFPAEMRVSIDDDPLPYGIEINYKKGRDPRINHELLDR